MTCHVQLLGLDSCVWIASVAERVMIGAVVTQEDRFQAAVRICKTG